MSSPSPPTSSRSAPAASRRLGYIDVARGLAVVLMIEAHTLDAWTRQAARDTIAFRNATVLGGFAAPLFLWLAGVGVAIAAARAAERARRPGAGVDAVVQRGLEIFVLAFLFRLQGFVLTPGGSPLMLFRVDILNVMGPAMAAAALVWGAARTNTRRVLWLSAATIVVAIATPLVRASGAVDRLPLWLQWYARPAGDLTTFTLFPWAGFLFGGAAVGVLIAAVERRAQPRLHAAIAVAGAVLVLVGFWTSSLPSIYRTSSFWTSSPTFFAIRLGVLMIAFSGLYAVETLGHVIDARSEAASAAGSRSSVTSVVSAAVSASQRPLERLGRASLFIYWIHVELVYGYASWLWRHRLPFWGTAIAFVGFCALMYGAVVLRDRVVSGRATRPRAVTQAATA